MQLAKSFISCNGKHYFVSTINRESSAMLAHGDLYAETIAWEWNPETNTRGEQVKQDSSYENSLEGHKRVMDFIYHGGLI